MNPNFDFLSKIRTRLEQLWGNVTSKAKPAKVVSPVPENVIPAISSSGPPPTSTPSPTPTASPTPYPTAAPGTENAMDFISSQMPPSYQGTPQEYFPALGNEEFMGGVQNADKLRQGMAGLLLLQSFFESTLGRGGQNYFGALPRGEGGGVSPSFQSPTAALDYQLGPNVLGGGANPNMNILGESTPLTEPDIRNLYRSYNPSGDYLGELISALFPQRR